MVTLTAIVPGTNGPPTLERCIAAIKASADPPEELIVVQEPRNAGPAEARNLGAGRAMGNVLVFVDADVEVHPDAFRRIRRAFQVDPELTALFGSYDDSPAAPGVVSAFRNLLHHYVHHAGAGFATTFWAGLGAVRRDAFVAAGGFDADRFPVPSIEDIELGIRLTATHARIALDPGIQGTHLKAWSLREMLRTDFARRGVPWVRLMLANQAPSTALNLGWRHRLSAGSCLLLVAALATQRFRLAGAMAAVFLGLNHSFYAFLLQRRSAPEAVAGVFLHAAHHLTAAASIPAGIAGHLLNRQQHG